MLSLILMMATAVYALRITGFFIADIGMPPTWERALRFVPVATLTALITVSLAGASDDRPIRLLAVVGAGVAAQYTGRAWVCIIVGVLTHGFLRLLMNGAG